MLVGYLIIISGCTLYWLLTPSIPGNSIFKKEEVFPRNPSLNGEGVAVWLISRPYIR